MRISDWSSDVCSSDLSITDNIVEGDVIHPIKVVIHDGDDPYFVVAADKGTASFSDVANAIAADHNFWLGAAFASGGSHGYDDKGMAITPRAETGRANWRGRVGPDGEYPVVCVSIKKK